MAVAERPTWSSTLPRGFYGDDPSLFEAEARRIWYRQWLYLAHTSEIPSVGDYVVRNVLGESVLLVRTSDTDFTAVMNVCRHRGSRIVDDTCGHARRFTCPYHQWTYGLDGRLIGAPSMRREESVDFGELGLYRVPLDGWGGFLFGCLGTDPPPAMAPEIQSLCPELGVYRPEKMQKVHSRTYDAACNWKVLLENYLECYHCRGSHPEYCLTAQLGLDREATYGASYTRHPYWGVDMPLQSDAKTASMDRDFCCRKPLVEQRDIASSIGRSRGFVIQPAFTVIYFYVDYAMVHEIRPVSPTQTQFHIHWFLSGDAEPSDYELDNLVHVWDRTTVQDVELVERTQMGLRSRRYAPGPLNTTEEPGIRASLDTYLDIMIDDDVVTAMMQAAGLEPN